MRRCQWCKDGIAKADKDGVEYVECALIPPAPITVQTVANGQIVTTLNWVRPPMTLLGWCGQFKLSLWKFLFSRDPRT